MSCNACGGRFTVGPSTFPGFDLLHCSGCDRPIGLVLQTGRRPSSRPAKRDLNRALRRTRRLKETS